MIEVNDLEMNPIGRIVDTWDNKQTLVLNKAGEFSFSMAMESLDLDSLVYRRNEALQFLRHQTYLRWLEDQTYLFTGKPYQIEQEETEDGKLLAHVKCRGIMNDTFRYNVRVRRYTNTRADLIVRELLELHPIIRHGFIDFQDEISIDFDYENLFDALFSLQETLGGDMYVDHNDLTFNWVRRMGEVGPEIRYQRNMTFIRFLSETADHFTRIIPLGAGEGENRVTIKDINEGRDYLEADTVDEYGVIEYLWEDEKYKDPYTLKRAAQRLLNERKHPTIAYETSMIDLSQWRDEWGEKPYRDSVPQLGDSIRIYHERLGIDVIERIVKIERNYDKDKRHQISIELAERRRTWAHMVAGIQDRLKNTRYDKGYLFTSNYSLSEDLTATTTKQMRFNLDPAISAINYARLLYTGSETSGETGDTLTATVTITVNGEQIYSGNDVQQELEIEDKLSSGWNTIEFSADGDIHVDAELSIKSFYER